MRYLNREGPEQLAELHMHDPATTEDHYYISRVFVVSCELFSRYTYSECGKESRLILITSGIASFTQPYISIKNIQITNSSANRHLLELSKTRWQVNLCSPFSILIAKVQIRRRSQTQEGYLRLVRLSGVFRSPVRQLPDVTFIEFPIMEITKHIT